MTIARGHANGLEKAFHLTKKPVVLYKVQIGAFQSKANADKLANEAKSKGFNSVVLLVNGLYKVQIGAFASQANADALAAKAKNAGFTAIVVKE